MPHLVKCLFKVGMVYLYLLLVVLFAQVAQIENQLDYADLDTNNNNNNKSEMLPFLRGVMINDCIHEVDNSLGCQILLQMAVNMSITISPSRCISYAGCCKFLQLSTFQ